MEQCIEKAILLGKTIVEVEIEEGVEDLMKGKWKVKREFESSVGVGKVGEVSPFGEKNKLEVAKLMNIVGLELKSSKVEMVKLKKKKEELTFKIGQGKVVLDSMHAIIFKAMNELKELLVIESTIHLDDLN
jgi:hypothetical protein